MRLRLVVPHADEWDLHTDEKRRDSVLFCPADDPPATGTRVTAEIVFLSGPRFFVRGKVIWRRPGADRRMPAGVGLELEPRYHATLHYINAWSGGEVTDRRELPRVPVRLRVAYRGEGQRRLNFTRDISAHGIYIHSTQLLALSDPINISLTPHVGSVIGLAGRVTRADESKDSPGMGIRLEFAEAALQSQFATFVDEIAHLIDVGQLPDELCPAG